LIMSNETTNEINDAILGVQATDPLQSDPQTPSDAAALHHDADLSGSRTIPTATLDAMLKVKRTVKRKNMTRDEWIKRCEFAEMELHEHALSAMRSREETTRNVARLERELSASKNLLNYAAAAILLIGAWLVGYTLFRFFFAS